MPTPATIVLQMACAVIGADTVVHIHDVNDRPIEDAFVQVIEPGSDPRDEPFAKGYTDADGDYVVSPSLAENVGYRILVKKAGYKPKVEDDCEAGDTIDVELVRRRRDFTPCWWYTDWLSVCHPTHSRQHRLYCSGYNPSPCAPVAVGWQWRCRPTTCDVAQLEHRCPKCGDDERCCLCPFFAAPVRDCLTPQQLQDGAQKPPTYVGGEWKSIRIRRLGRLSSATRRLLSARHGSISASVERMSPEIDGFATDDRLVVKE